ncbi:hypothetical protein ACQP1G_38840 [Nocardia sp. CA-107356]|uniref:hypothetical protein n=1 Tax=Nocardia sp. CA-107356 TaxID=3239972 RepID=UPI003D8BFD93
MTGSAAGSLLGDGTEPELVRPQVDTPEPEAARPNLDSAPREALSQPVARAADMPRSRADSREPAEVPLGATAADVVMRPRTDVANEPPTHPIAVEMAARHDLEITGFHVVSVDTYAVQEIAAAIDDMLTRYPIALRGIAITDPDNIEPPRAVRGHSSNTSRSGPRAIWMVLHGPTLATLVPPTRNAPPRRWLRKRRAADRPVYAAVVREFGCALEVAGDFRARQEAQRTLITESLRGSADLTYSPLDPGPALLDAFTEVALHGDRAGKLAKVLHDILVKMAGAETTDISA